MNINERTKPAIIILISGILLGVFTDRIININPFALGAFLLFLGILATIILVARTRTQYSLLANDWMMFGAATFLASSFLWRASEFLLVLNFLLIAVLMVSRVTSTFGVKPWAAGIIHYIAAATITGLNFFVGPILLLANDISWKSSSFGGSTRTFLAVLKGIVIVIPMIIVFGTLFIAADASFEAFVSSFVNLNLGLSLPHVLASCVFAWLIAGFFRASNWGLSINQSAHVALTDNPTSCVASYENPNSDTKQPRSTIDFDLRNFDNTILPRALTLGKTEIYVILGGIDILFFAFVLFQLPYLFGGIDLVHKIPDLKLSEYARRGFGELVMVAIIALPLLLITDWLVRRDKGSTVKLFRVLAGFLVLLVFVVLTSAAHRLILVSGDLGYGMTLQRFYPLCFVFLLALIFFWFAVTVLRGERKLFAWGSMWSAVILLSMINVMNPDAFIVQRNIELYQQGRPLDTEYFFELSEDATPEMIAVYPKLSGENQTQIIEVLNRQVCSEKKYEGIASFLNFNLSRERGVRAIPNEIRAKFVGCEKYRVEIND